MESRGKAAFYTLGCKLNFSETSTLARSLEKEGYEKTSFEESADVYVINTCSVTENADKKFKSIARQAHKTNPEALIIAVGCYAQLKPQELAKVDGVDMVLGAKEKFELPAFLNDLLQDNDAIKSGLGYEELQGILPHNSSIYNSNSLPRNKQYANNMKMFMKKYFFLTKQELNYEKINCIFRK